MQKLLKIPLLLFIFTVFFFGFVMPAGMPGGSWTQQFMPDLGGQSIRDIIFLDSMTGYAVSSKNVNPDSSSILKTTNGGDNWQIIFSQTPRRFSNISFINDQTGFVSGGSGSGTPYLYKTTNSGGNWFTIPGATLGNAFWAGMSVINEDSIFLIDENSLNGGVFRTTNGGANWTQQLSLGSANPDHIYMYDGKMGFIADNPFPPVNNRFYKTTNGGVNWFNVNNDGFRSMKFIDSLTGWKATGIADSSMKKTTDGGITWTTQQMPSGGFIESNVLTRFSIVSNDTLWGCGGYLRYPNNQTRGIIYRSTNGGNNWHFQVPDTSLPIIAQYEFINFYGDKYGWVYANFPTYISGLHTTTGGDTNWITGIEQISNEIPNDFMLYQNYPNPFNPTTKIKFKVQSLKNIKLNIFDITGKEITVLVNKKLQAGEYEYTFNGSGLSSGIYFYSLSVNGEVKDTKKMLMIK